MLVIIPTTTTTIRISVFYDHVCLCAAGVFVRGRRTPGERQLHGDCRHLHDGARPAGVPRLLLRHTGALHHGRRQRALTLLLRDPV